MTTHVACPALKLKEKLHIFIHKLRQGEAFRGDQAKDREGKEEFRFAIDAIKISGERCVVAILVRKQGPLEIQF